MYSSCLCFADLHQTVSLPFNKFEKFSALFQVLKDFLELQDTLNYHIKEKLDNINIFLNDFVFSVNNGNNPASILRSLKGRQVPSLFRTYSHDNRDSHYIITQLKSLGNTIFRILHHKQDKIYYICIPRHCIETLSPP